MKKLKKVIIYEIECPYCKKVFKGFKPQPIKGRLLVHIKRDCKNKK